MRGSNKNKGGVGLFQISQKERLFHLLWQPSALGDNSECGPSSRTLPRRAFFSPSVWPRRKYIQKLNCKESLLICFEKFMDAPFSHWQSRNRMMNTFIIVSITAIFNSLEDICYAWVHFKNAVPLTSLGHSLERRA